MNESNRPVQIQVHTYVLLCVCIHLYMHMSCCMFACMHPWYAMNVLEISEQEKWRTIDASINITLVFLHICLNAYEICQKAHFLFHRYRQL